jgi:site-specific DNA recombinase
VTRAAIYARYSTDRQSESSAEDQARLCRERASREGWIVVAEFLDPAISGATRDRPQLNALMARAAEFDVVVTESLDRLSRDQEDIAAIHKRLRFAGVEIVTLADGAIGEIHIGLKGTMAALFLKDLGDKTRRGQIGRVAAGRIPGGLSYGYEKVQQLDERGEPMRGLRAVNAVEAAIVRRIFAEYAAGLAPREIAKRLNADGVPPPRGGFWRANTIVGHRTRRNGILNNDLYAGRIVFNRQRFIRDPITRKRVSRPNPESEWVIQDAPDLRIIDDEAWRAVEASIHRRSRPFNRQRRPRHLFSGLLTCGRCGGPVTIIQADKWGCSRHREAGLCSNGRMLRNDTLERRVMAGLKDRLLAPELVEEYVRAYHEHATTLVRDLKRKQERLSGGLRAAEAKVKHLVDAIAAGADVGDIKEALIAAAAERDRLKAERVEIDAAKIIPLHPRLADGYRQRIDGIATALRGEGLHQAEAKATLRGMIDKIVVTAPIDGRPPRRDGSDIEIELHGRLAEIIGATDKKRAPAEAGAYRTVQVVAGARSRLCSPLAVVRI